MAITNNIRKQLLTEHARILLGFIEALQPEQDIPWAMRDLIKHWLPSSWIEKVIIDRALRRYQQGRLSARLLVLVANGGKSPEELEKERVHKEERMFNASNRIQSLKDSMVISKLPAVASRENDYPHVNVGYGIRIGVEQPDGNEDTEAQQMMPGCGASS